MELDELRELLKKSTFLDTTIPGMEVATYFRHWDRVTFLARERGGRPRPTFIPHKSQKFLDEQFCLAAGLMEMGVGPGDRIAVFSPNSLRTAVEIFALLSLGAVVVPVYPNLTEDATDLLLRHSGTRWIIAGGAPQLQRARNILDRVKTPLRKIIVSYDFASEGDTIVAYDDIVRMGRRSNLIPKIVERIGAIKPDDSAVLLYTPGTSGVPKGVPLSHANFLAQRSLSEFLNMDPREVKLAHLPFSHVFGLSADLFSSAYFGTVTAICASFQTEDILRDIAEVKPTVMSSVPRMYEKIYSHVMHTIGQFGKIRRRLFRAGIRIGRNHYERACAGRRVSPLLSVANLIAGYVHWRVRGMLSMGRIKMLFSGGAPLQLEVALFFGGIGLPILEGYGLTETSPIINMNRPGRNRPGTVGPPVPGVTEKISEEGEVLVKGPMVFSGYLDDLDEDRAAFTDDGFFRTGDIGQLDDDGNLTITSRLKDIIITSGGKNICPLVLERLFDEDELIEHICVVGDRRKYLSALVVPDFAFLSNYARTHNVRYYTNDDLVKKPEIVTLYRKRIEQVCAPLAQYEQIKRFTLLPNEFSIETGELAATLKLRRAVIQEKHREIIDRMYPESDLVSPARS